MSEVSVLFAIWTIAALLFELPTGLIADKYPRKYILICGELVNAGAFLVWLFMPTFLGYAVGFILWGAAYALKSGAYQALIYDELAASNQTKDYTKMMSRIKAAEFSGMLLAFITAYAMSMRGVDYTLLLCASIATGLLSAILLLFVPNTRQRDAAQPTESQLKLLKRTFRVIVRTPNIQNTVAWLAIVGGFIGWYEEYTPLFDSAAGIPTKFIPLVISGALVLNILASLIAYRFESEKLLSKTLLILSAGVVALCATLGWWLPVAILFVHSGLILLRVLRILLDAELQHAAESSVRATLGSVAGFLSYPITVAVALGFAGLSKNMHGFLPFRWVSIALLVCGAVLLVVTMRSSKMNRSIITTKIKKT